MRGILLVLLMASFAGCVGDESNVDSKQTEAPDWDRPYVVVAVIDSGINPYHSEFREWATPGAEDRAGTPLNFTPSAAYEDPARLIEGYPENVRPVELSFDAADYKDAVAMDAGLWANTSAGELVRFPGTKIVGAISFQQDGRIVPRPENPFILDSNGHGTMVASRIAGNTVSLGGPEVRLVSVQMSGVLDELASAADGVRWVAQQDWIDIVSCSWGLPAPLGPAAGPYTEWTDAIAELAAKKPTFFAAGNGLGNGLGTGYPSELQDSLPADVITVGGNDNGGYVYWSNWNPQLSGDAVMNPAAEHDSLDSVTNTGGGTSSASPFTAGGGAAVLLEARRILGDSGGLQSGGLLAQAGPEAQLPSSGPLADGDFTLAEFKSVLFHTAVPPQEDESDGDAFITTIPVPMQDALPATLYPFFGYGEVNTDSVEAAVAVLRGELEEPDRPVEDQLYAADYQARQAIYGS